MKRIVVSEFVTVDGMMDDPGGSEGHPRGGWAFKFQRGPEGDKFKLDELQAADTLLLGRVTYDGFAAAWPGRTGEFADKMNNMPKYVVSTTMKEAPWKNSKVISSNVVEEVRRLRSMPGADILIAAIGKPEFVTADMVKPGAVVIDVGINRVDDATQPKGYRIVGDVAFGAVSQVASKITPVPGGVGPMTIAMLLKNTVRAAAQGLA